MKRGLRIALALLLALLFSAVFVPDLEAQVTSPRTITLRVAADEELRALDNWEGKR